jgi:hypothetical protein
MTNRTIASMLGGALLLAATSAMAQPAPPAPLAIPNPMYTTMVLEEPVNKPAAEVWAKIGKFCDIGDWLQTQCALTGGDYQLGAVRRLGPAGNVIEMLVAKTDLSYTYTQPVRVGVPFNAYHGTLEVKPVTAKTSKLVYSFFYDVSMLADDAARATEANNRRTRFQQALVNAKTLAEGGKLPPPAAR